MKDVTQYDNLYDTYINEAPVIFNINIDNYSDVLAILDDTKTSELEARVRMTINEWSINNRVFLKKIRNDAYIALIQESTYQNILKQKFSLIEDIKKIVEEENNFTISIGIGRGINDFVKLSELASSAMDVALSRGGDQCVVNTYGKNMEFYGGGSESKSKRHKVKVKVVSKSLSALIQSYDSIYIMGHDQADFDAIGACLGMYSITKQMNKNVRIIYDDKSVEFKARRAFRESFEKEEIDEMIIKPNKAIEEMDENSLLILVDVSNAEITMSQKVVDAAEKIAVIDHHRPGEKLLSQIFSYQESAASSTCEMVSEIIRYSENKIRVTPEVATYMLTGILLDTNNYKNRTGSRTYEASMILKEYGADNVQATEFLKEEYEEYQLKTKIMANSETPYYGVVVCYASEEDIIDRTMLAMVGQEVLNVKEIKACFVIGKISDTNVGISARSDGTINVQKIMESLNGGGHFSSAATQIEEVTIEEAKKMLYSKLEGFVGDTRIE
jgi:c-di-AMP phosphodiesterase-like protein